MTKDMRRAKRISVELPVKVYFFDNTRKTRSGVALTGRIKNFSPLGAAMVLSTIMLDRKHLFHTCADNPDIALELTFEPGGCPDKTITVLAVPVWFNQDLESDSARFCLGLKFLTHPASPEIKLLSQVTCRDENRLFSLWKRILEPGYG